jgi:predicted SnoaL-like aldol condensation-catalyzing enzyme
MTDMAKQLKQNKELVSRLILECFSGGHLHVIDEIVSPEFEFHYPNMPSGLEGLKAIVRKNNDTFTDCSFKITTCLPKATGLLPSGQPPAFMPNL